MFIIVSGVACWVIWVVAGVISAEGLVGDGNVRRICCSRREFSATVAKSSAWLRARAAVATLIWRCSNLVRSAVTFLQAVSQMGPKSRREAHKPYTFKDPRQREMWFRTAWRASLDALILGRLRE